MPKSRFNEINYVITRSNESRLMTSIGKKKITLKNSEKLLGGIVSRNIDKKEARKMCNSIADKLNRLELTEPRVKMLPIFKQLQDIFMGTKADDKLDHEVDDETDDETNEQPDTTDMPELKSEQSAAQGREHERKGIEILTSEQMLSRIQISLAQLKSRNNSEKLKNEIRQLLDSLYR